MLPVKGLLMDGYWIGVQDGDLRARALFRKHYSHRRYKDGRDPKLFVGPGEKMVLMTVNCDALFVWRKFISFDKQTGVNCAVFRNESDILSSILIREATGLAWQRWPGERLYTYVNPSKIRSSNPGCCFKMVGWTVCGKTKSGLVILEVLPPAPITVKPDSRGETARRVQVVVVQLPLFELESCASG